MFSNDAMIVPPWSDAIWLGMTIGVDVALWLNSILFSTTGDPPSSGVCILSGSMAGIGTTGSWTVTGIDVSNSLS